MVAGYAVRQQWCLVCRKIYQSIVRIRNKRRRIGWLSRGESVGATPDSRWIVCPYAEGKFETSARNPVDYASKLCARDCLAKSCPYGGNCGKAYNWFWQEVARAERFWNWMPERREGKPGG